MKTTTLSMVALAVLAAVVLAQPVVGILPGEEVPAIVDSPAAPQQGAAPRPGILPGEEVPVAIASATAEATDSLDWGVSRIGAGADLWAKTRGKGVKVAVLDTGCDLAHPDLATGIVGSKDFTGSRSGPSDVHGHGTHVAGVIGARLNGQGIAGVAPECGVIVVKVLGDNGYGTDPGIAAGIDHAKDADVINMSLGSPVTSVVIHAAVKRAVASGCIVIAAADNRGPNEGTVGYPGGYPECVCVGATGRDDIAARFSSRGPPLFVAAPGVSIRSCYPGSRYAEMSGSSMAAPHVAGAAALWVAANQHVPRVERPAKFRAALMASCQDVQPNGRDTATGYGLIRLPQLLDGGAVVPPTPMPLVITEADLADEARRRLDATFPGGRFRLEIMPAQPKE